jgi:sterol desaturase/sphingolipid hydroxylase (fatty acid hydroxylase superfamily)
MIEFADGIIHYIWIEILHPSQYFRHDTFEVIQSAVLFFIFITGFGVLDFYLPSTHDVYRIKHSSGSLRSWKGRYVALYEEMLWYILPWIVIDYYCPRRHLLLEQNAAAPSAMALLLDISWSLVLYDSFFFIGHFLMHKNRYLYEKVHAKHHTMKAEIRANDAIRHTFLDGTFDVLCSVAALRASRAHPLSRMVYNIVAVYLITEAHSGFDFPWSFHNLLPSVFLGPVRHRQHHLRGNVEFAKFFRHWDYICGTCSVANTRET